MKFRKKNKLLLLAVVVLSVVLVIMLLLLVKLSGTEQTDPTSGQTVPGTTAPSASVTAPTTTRPTTQPTTLPQETFPLATLHTVPEMQASYEQWLAASMYMLVYFQYPDCEVVGIYAASETDIAARMESMGSYLSIRSGGEEIWIHSAPLAEGRNEKGTVDLHTAQLGYATFDVVDPVDVSSMIEITQEDLLGPMEYTMLPGLTVN